MKPTDLCFRSAAELSQLIKKREVSPVEVIETHLSRIQALEPPLNSFYLSGESKVIYCSKDGKQEKVFDALEWLAAMGSHVPNKAEQMVRYYGYYSNVSRGKRGKLNLDEAIPCILMSEEGAKKYRKNWARLLQKIYEADPLTCPKCQGRMKI